MGRPNLLAGQVEKNEKTSVYSAERPGQMGRQNLLAEEAEKR